MPNELTGADSTQASASMLGGSDGPSHLPLQSPSILHDYPDTEVRASRPTRRDYSAQLNWRVLRCTSRSTRFPPNHPLLRSMSTILITSQIHSNQDAPSLLAPELVRRPELEPLDRQRLTTPQHAQISTVQIASCHGKRAPTIRAIRRA